MSNQDNNLRRLQHKQLPKDLATKEDLKKGLNNLESVLRKDLASKKDLVKWKDEILTSNDKVVGKLDKILTEQAAITGNYKNLDKRVEKLEDVVLPDRKGNHVHRPTTKPTFSRYR